jgi:inosose dehydratase
MSISRRHFLLSIGAAAAGSALPLEISGGLFSPPLYPPADLSYFNRPITPAPAKIRFGYAAITWNGKDEQAIKEISEVGFRGIQLRSNILKGYGDRPKALRDLLDQYHLLMVALSSGGVAITAGSLSGLSDMVSLTLGKSAFGTGQAKWERPFGKIASAMLKTRPYSIWIRLLRRCC